MRLFINVYEVNELGKKVIKKQCDAETIDLEFGTIAKLMELVNIENIDSLPDLLKAIYGTWEEIKSVLSEAFPDMQPEDWEHVRVKELYPTIRDILKFSIMEIAGIPSEGKN
ncbi:hypothetical protein ACQCP7_25795 [Ralstonia pseudosolanacearum]|uniref:hypothetical protein n=1 Tax=Ralstonia pseudosolanacearum TaxID=1310165 RepID=UPI003CEDAD12